MLYIELQADSLEWDFREEAPFDNIEDIIDEVKWIKADGQECSFIIDRFSYTTNRDEITTIPVKNKGNIKLPFQYWYGDIARTILLTLGTV